MKTGSTIGEGSTSTTVCPFCVLHDPLVTVWSAAHVQALVSRAPINRYHIIIVPRQHAERLPDVPPDVGVSVWTAAPEVARAIAAVAKPDGIMYIAASLRVEISCVAPFTAL